jgi:hypothetical protein
MARGHVKSKSPVGRTIVGIRGMTAAELEGRMWSEDCIVLMLDDNTSLYPMRDPEGNGPGALVHALSSSAEELLFVKRGELKT